MDVSTAPLALVGAMAGLMLWSRIVKIFFGVLAAARKTDLAALFGELTPQKIRKLLAILLVASCVWAFAFALLAIHFMPPNTSGLGWVWFFGGMASAPLFVWVTTLKAVRKIKQRNPQGAQP
jgi:hypothetical protein